MRVLLFFDLPTITTEDKRNYSRFRKFLIQNGFIMLQESVYTRMLITPSAEQSVYNLIKANKPPSGIIQLISLTEKQFSRMEYIVGEHNSEVIDTDERLVII